MTQFVHLKEMVSGPGFFSEAKQYSDSSEFTDEFYSLFEQVTKMKKIMKNPKWLEYMKMADRNLDIATESAARDAIKAVSDLENALHDIDDEFDRANGEEPTPRDVRRVEIGGDDE
jgi:hypothetical protein